MHQDVERVVGGRLHNSILVVDGVVRDRQLEARNGFGGQVEAGRPGGGGLLHQVWIIAFASEHQRLAARGARIRQYGEARHVL